MARVLFRCVGVSQKDGEEKNSRFSKFEEMTERYPTCDKTLVF
jgi:hypothetical protein